MTKLRCGTTYKPGDALPDANLDLYAHANDLSAKKIQQGRSYHIYGVSVNRSA